MPIGVRRVHDRRVRTEAARLVEQLDRTHGVLREALLDLARLLVRVHMQRQRVRCGVRAELAQGVGRARADGMRGDSDTDAVAAQRLDLLEVLGHGLLAEPIDAAAEIAGIEEDERDTGLGRRLSGRMGLLEAEVVELADRREAVGPQLPVDLDVLAADLLDGQRVRQREHPVPPRPEVTATVAASKCALERVAVRVDEAVNLHRHILSVCGAGSRMP